jgi:ribonuclease HI
VLPTPATKHNKGRNGIRNTQETMNTRYPQDKSLHIFTVGSQINVYINAGAGIYCELFSCYMPLGKHSTAFDREIEDIRTALRLLNLHQNKFERAVIFSDSKATILSAGSTESVISTETVISTGAEDYQVLIRQLKAKHKLQWIPGQCQIAGNEHGDAMAKKIKTCSIYDSTNA